MLAVKIFKSTFLFTFADPFQDELELIPAFPAKPSFETRTVKPAKKPSFETRNVKPTTKPNLETSDLKPSTKAYQECTSHYDSYISLIDDEDEDPLFLAAVEASIAEAEQPSDFAQSTAENLLQEFILTNLIVGDEEDKQHVVISRKHVFPSTVRAIKRSAFTFIKPLMVTFSGEEAVDTGGPKREFLRLLMMEVGRSSIFNGSWLSHDVSLLCTKQYHLAGQLIAWSILQGGPGPQCLSLDLFKLLIDVKADRKVLLDLCLEGELKEIIQDLENCSENEFEDTIDKHADAIAKYGYTKVYRVKFQEKDEVADCLLKNNFIFSVHAEIQQLKEGMNTIGKFGDLVFGNVSLFSAVLGNKTDNLTYSTFKRNYIINFSESGSNKRNEEDKTMYSFEVFTQDLHDKQVQEFTLEDLLVFVTGADRIPPLGFESPIKIEFFDAMECPGRLPWSSTCSPALFLPRGKEDPEELKEMMKQVLSNCHGFGKV